jgi:hypothetical protein
MIKIIIQYYNEFSNTISEVFFFFNTYFFFFFTVPHKEKFTLVVEGEFKITNIPFTISFVNRNSTEFQELSNNITTQVIFHFIQPSIRVIRTFYRNVIQLN